MRFLRTPLAVIEPVAIFIAATLLSGALLDMPFAQAFSAKFGEPAGMLALRWAPLVAAALLLDLILRKRGLAAWGLFTPWREPLGGWRAIFFLLVVGGGPALALTLMLPPADGGFSSLGLSPQSLAAGAAMALSPVLGQEIFVCGYAQTRFSDALNRWIVALLVAALFALAHLSHAEAGPLGWAFVAAMAAQGLMWSLARSAGAPLTLLIAAHVLLLAAYEAPLAGLAIIALGAAASASRLGAWLRAMDSRPPRLRGQADWPR